MAVPTTQVSFPGCVEERKALSFPNHRNRLTTKLEGREAGGQRRRLVRVGKAGSRKVLGLSSLAVCANSHHLLYPGSSSSDG